MTSTQLPPLDFDDGGLRIVLHPEPDNGTAPPFAPDSDHDHEPASYETLSSACYSERNYTADAESDYGHENDMYEAEPPDSPQQKIPIHPIPGLQDAFTESLHEVTSGTAVEKPKLRDIGATARREALLAQGKDDAPFDATWRLRPGQSQHEISKLIAQISFGVYLLLNGMANSNTQVVSILQGHIDEVDEFLEALLEDIAHTEKDLTMRIDHLLLTMSNMKVFEQLLEDRKFRTDILEGNETIEHILARTRVVTKQWDDDIEAGLLSSNLFINWLNEHGDETWRAENPEVVDIFDAMNGNAEGWLIAFEKISDHTQDMNSLIVRLMNIISEMETKAGEASRRTWTNITPFSAPPGTNTTSTTSTTKVRTSAPMPRSSSLRAPPRPPNTSRVGRSTDDGDTIQFPMPTGAPLISPLRAPPASPGGSSTAKPPHTLAPQNSIPEYEDSSDDDDAAPGSEAIESLYLLQPRTYTPQPPPPLPSPYVKDESAPAGHLELRQSLRQRVSAKTSPPGDIQIPTRSLNGVEVYAPSPTSSSPMTIATDVEYHSRHQPQTAGSHQSDLSPPVYPSVMGSPRSDQQRYYHPVIASPHSPLQQRPHTAVGHGGHAQAAFQQPGATLVPPHHLRTEMSNATLSTDYNGHSATRSTRTTRADDKQLKKKKSAFGWLKKAFSMDEEERAAYEARRAMQYHDNPYRTPSSQKFLDGRRVR